MEFDNSVPIYIQLVEQLKMDIVSGKLKPGERMLSVRELALKVKVNPNTVQRALVELEDMKLIYTERTTGKFVTKDENLIKKYLFDIACELTNNFVSNMQELGFTNEEIIKFIKDKEGGKQ